MGKVSVTLSGGPLDGRSLDIGEHSTKLVVMPDWMPGLAYEPTVWVYLKTNDWVGAIASPEQLEHVEA